MHILAHHVPKQQKSHMDFWCSGASITNSENLDADVRMGKNQCLRTCDITYLDKLKLMSGQRRELRIQRVPDLRLAVPAHFPQGCMIVDNAHVLSAQPAHHGCDHPQLIYVSLSRKQWDACCHFDQQATCVHKQTIQPRRCIQQVVDVYRW